MSRIRNSVPSIHSSIHPHNMFKINITKDYFSTFNKYQTLLNFNNSLCYNKKKHFYHHNCTNIRNKALYPLYLYISVFIKLYTSI